MKMKCFFVALALSVVMCITVQAQDEMRQELSISYGAVPNSIWMDAISDLFSGLAGKSATQDKHFGPLGVEYFCHTSSLVGVGAVAVIHTSSEDYCRNNQLDNHSFKGYYTLMPAVKFNWLRKEHWGMYNKIALGATYAHGTTQDYNDNGVKSGEVKTEDSVLFNFQVSLGVEAGKNHMWGFTEVGIGEQGIAMLGVRYKF